MLSNNTLATDFYRMAKKEALELFAHHYETGELIPMELVEKIKESATFQEGMATVRQLSFGLLDMSWHGLGLQAVRFGVVGGQDGLAMSQHGQQDN